MSRESLRRRVAALHALPSVEMRHAIRAAAGQPLDAVGKAFDPPVCASTVLRWERGERTPRGEHLEQYVEILAEMQALAS
jgi:hypothetical protein